MQLIMGIQTDVLIVGALDLIGKSYESGGVNANNFIFISCENLNIVLRFQIRETLV